MKTVTYKFQDNGTMEYGCCEAERDTSGGCYGALFAGTNLYICLKNGASIAYTFGMEMVDPIRNASSISIIRPWSSIRGEFDTSYSRSNSESIARELS